MRRRAAARAAAAAPAANERYYLASQWQLAWRKLLRHRLALAGGGVLLLLYAAALFAGFMAPYGPFTRNNDYINAPPTPLRLVAEDGLHLRPFVYAVRGEVDMESLRRRYADDTSRRYPLSLLVRGEPYRLWGLIETDRHLFGVEEPGVIYLFGTDDLGRDMFARVAGALDGAIIRCHLLPSFMSYLIVSLTLAVPGMILGETALSFLGLGLRPPVVSWGVLLQKAQNLRTVALHPWLLIPAGFVVITVLAFNFLGDGLRDAADPYK